MEKNGASSPPATARGQSKSPRPVLRLTSSIAPERDCSHSRYGTSTCPSRLRISCASVCARSVVSSAPRTPHEERSVRTARRDRDISIVSDVTECFHLLAVGVPAHPHDRPLRLAASEPLLDLAPEIGANLRVRARDVVVLVGIQPRVVQPKGLLVLALDGGSPHEVPVFPARAVERTAFAPCAVPGQSDPAVSSGGEDG